ncbi:MAG: universal stress protein [Pseudomonadota bacterium]
MFENILVPTDLAQRSRRALAIALRMATPGTGTVSLLHVIETLADTPFEEIKDFYARLEERAHAGMDEMTAPVRDSRVEIIQKISYGNRAQEILRAAQEMGADLIVLNSHKVEPQDTAGGWGTISYKVGILAQCPVMLVK